MKCGKGAVKMLSFRGCSNLTCFQPKMDCYTYELIHVSHIITTKQKPIVGTQEIMRVESRHNTKEIHQPQGKRAREKKGTGRNHETTIKQ